MADESTGGKPKKKKSPNVVRAAMRAATNLPTTRGARAALNCIASYADFGTGRNAFMTKATIARETGYSEREAQRDLKVLRGGVWIEAQKGGPDEHAREAYLRTYPDPRHRPPVYRVVLETLAAPRGDGTSPLNGVEGGRDVSPKAEPRGDETAAQGETKRPPKGRRDGGLRGDTGSSHTVPAESPAPSPSLNHRPEEALAAFEDDLAWVLRARAERPGLFRPGILSLVSRAERGAPLSGPQRGVIADLAESARAALSPGRAADRSGKRWELPPRKPRPAP
jgi:hypothetical protein